MSVPPRAQEETTRHAPVVLNTSESQTVSQAGWRGEWTSWRSGGKRERKRGTESARDGSEDGAAGGGSDRERLNCVISPKRRQLNVRSSSPPHTARPTKQPTNPQRGRIPARPLLRIKDTDQSSLLGGAVSATDTVAMRKDHF